MPKKTQKKCCWIRDVDRCKPGECSYKHIKKRTLKNTMDEILKKVEILEAQIKMYEIAESLQAGRLSNIMKQDREKGFEERVRI